MNRETEQHFTQLPEIHVPRSKFVKPHSHTTTFDAAELIPIFVDSDILPGTTVNMKMASVVRMLTPLYPTYGNLFLDLMWFFVPHRLVWEHWREFWGENANPWYPNVAYTTPQLVVDKKINGNYVGADAKSLWDYMGLPTYVTGGELSVSALPFRAYCKIYNDWYKSQPLQQDLAFSMGDADRSYDFLLTVDGGVPARANKYHDYFTSSLPSLMYGNEINIPLGTWAPVKTRDVEIGDTTGETVIFRSATGGTLSAGYKPLYLQGSGVKTTLLKHGPNEASNPSSTFETFPTNLWADLANGIGPSLTALRQAVAIDHYLEARARTGGRYVEFLRGIFGIDPSDASLQRSEYLGGKRIPINIFSQVQSSSTDQTSPLGTVGAFSHTADSNEYFTKSFDEHGTLMCLACVRYDHSYQQGIPRMWSRKTPYDYYLPQFNGLSEQSILNKEIYATGTATDDQVFGYQEYAAEYRYANSYVTGEMRSNYSTSLDAWHYADDYSQLPVLGATWIRESESQLNRTLAVNSNVANQFLADFYFKPTYVMPMPIYSVPGLETL